MLHLLIFKMASPFQHAQFCASQKRIAREQFARGGSQRERLIPYSVAQYLET
jgi:hypothetical protein